jgi:hypothetical protein
MATHQEQAGEQAKALRLQQAAKQAFGRLLRTEHILLDKAPTSGGEWALASSDQDADNNAAKDGKEWPRDREIRAELLRWLCVDEYARKQVDPHGLSARGAKIIGHLDLSHVAVPFPLQFQQCYFEEPPNLFQSEVPGLNLSGSRVPGMNATNSRIKGTVWLGEGFDCDGEVTLAEAHIEGDLQCSGGTFRNPRRNAPETGKWDPNTGTALNADGVTVDGFVLLRREQGSEITFRSEGEVRFLGAQIRGDLDCHGGNFSNLPTKAFTTGDGLNAERAIVKGSIFLRDGFVAEGVVRLYDAQVGGNLDCNGGSFSNPLQEKNVGGDALLLDRAVIKGGVLFSSAKFSGDEEEQRFFADGNVSLIGTIIGGELDLRNGYFKKATLDLGGATAASFSDSGKTSWPKRDNLYLRLFQYGHIDPEVAEERLRWLGLQPDDDFNTESYVQLAKVLQQSGDDDGARLVLQTAAALQDRHGHRYWYLRPDNWFAASIGYGYRPIWAVGYISLMSTLGWIIYRRGYLARTMVPTDKDAYNELKLGKRLPPHYPRFAPLIFSLENSLPLVKLGQADKWQPDTELSGQTTSPRNSELPTLLSLMDGSSFAGAPPNSAVVAPGVGTTAAPAPVAKVPESSPDEASLAHHELTVEPVPPMFAALRRGVGRILHATGLQPDSSGQTPTTPLSRHGTSPKFLKWFIWIQILLGWLFATLFVAGVTGIVRKQ